MVGYIRILACILLLPFISTAQQWLVEDSTKGQFFVKVNPFALLEPDGGLKYSAEYILHEMWGFQLEVQPILYAVKLEQNRGNEVPLDVMESNFPRGIMLRPEVKFYFPGTRSKRRARLNKPFRFAESTRYFIGMDFLYKHVNVKRMGEVEIASASNTQPSFTQITSYNDIRKVVGGHFKLGIMEEMAPNGKWYMELSTGLGIRERTLSYKNLPANAIYPDRHGIFWSNMFIDPKTGISKQTILSIPCTLKFGFRF